jgi:hypothetical protein
LNDPAEVIPSPSSTSTSASWTTPTPTPTAGRSSTSASWPEFANEHLGDDRLEVTFALAVNEGGEELEGHDEVVDWEDEFGLEEGRCLAVRGVTVCASGATILLYRVR